VEQKRWLMLLQWKVRSADSFSDPVDPVHPVRTRNRDAAPRAAAGPGTMSRFPIAI
jgi:hypothetical protein